MTGPLPGNITFSTLRAGRFGLDVIAAGDADGFPDFVPYTAAQLTVTITASILSILDASASPDPMNIGLRGKILTPDAQGWMVDADGNRDIKLIETDNGALGSVGWTYRATFTGTEAGRYREKSFAAPGGATQNLLLLLDAPSSSGTTLSAAEIAVAAASAQAAFAAASAGTATAAAATAIAATAGKVDKGSIVVLDTDYASLELALAATPTGGTLEIRSAWSRATTFTVAKSVTIRGAKSGSITVTAANVDGITVTASGVTVDGLRITGSGDGTYGTGCGIRATATEASPNVGLVVRNCEINDWGRAAIHTESGYNFRITGNNIHDIAYSAVEILSGADGAISGNNILDVTMPSPLVNAYGIALTRNSAVNMATAPRSRRILVTENTIRNIPSWEGIDTHAGQQITVSRNKVYNCNVGIAMVGGSDGTGGTDGYAPQDIVVTENIVDSTVTDGSRIIGIELVGANTSVGVTCEYATGIIANNTIIGYGPDAAVASQGAIYLRDTRGAKVQGNRIIDPGGAAIVLYHDNDRFTLSNNTIQDVWQSSSTPRAVRVSSTYNNGVVSGTQIVRGLKSATVVNSYGIQIVADATNLITDGGGNMWSNAATLPVVGRLAGNTLGVAVQSDKPTAAIAQTVSRAVTFGNGAMTSGTMYLLGIPLTPGDIVTSLTFASGTTALAGGTHGWAALYDSALTLLGQSPDATSITWAASTAKTFTLNTPVNIATQGWYYVAICVVASTTPTLLNVNPGSVVAGISPARYGGTNTGLTDTAPSTATAPAGSGSLYYAYAS